MSKVKKGYANPGHRIREGNLQFEIDTLSATLEIKESNKQKQPRRYAASTVVKSHSTSSLKGSYASPSRSNKETTLEYDIARLNGALQLLQSPKKMSPQYGKDY